MMSKFWKRVLSLSLAAFMVLSVVPQSVAVAQDDENATEEMIEIPQSIISVIGGKQHMQGFTTDGEYMYWSFTDRLIRTDMTGNNKETLQLTGEVHLGDIIAYNGYIYGTMAEGAFGNWDQISIMIFDASTLQQKGKIALLSNGKFLGGVDGITVGKDPDGNWKLMITAFDETGRESNNKFIRQYSLPQQDKDGNYTIDFEAAYKIPTGRHYYGIQNLAYDKSDDSYWLACYTGDQPYHTTDNLFHVSINADGTGEVLGGWNNYTACGFQPLGNGRYLMSRNGESAEGATGEAVLTQYDEFEGVTYLDTTRPEKTGIKGDANGDSDISIKDLVRVISEVQGSDKKASTDVFTRWAQSTVEEKDVDVVRDLLLAGSDFSKFPSAEQKVAKGKVIEMGIGRNSGDSIAYSSTDDSVAKVDKNGKVTTVGGGVATITLSYTPAGSDTEETKECKVLVEGRNELLDSSKALVETAKEKVGQEIALGRTVTEFVGNDYWTRFFTNVDFESAKAQYLKDGSNRYLLARVYVPAECGWADLQYGWQTDSRYTMASQSVTNDDWINYIFDMKKAYETESTETFQSLIKSFNNSGNTLDGQTIVYISSVGFAEGTCVKGTSANMDGVRIITTASDAAVSDAALLEELNHKGFITEVTATSKYPTCLLPVSWSTIKNHYNSTTSLGRYMKVRMYMPEDMKWANVAFGVPNSDHIKSATTTSGGKWVDYIFDIKSNYDKDYIYHIMSSPTGATLKDGKVVFYVSDVQFSNSVEDFAYSNSGKNGQVLTTESAEYAELNEAVRTEIAEKGSVAKINFKYAGSGIAAMPLDYYALRSAYSSSGNTANRYLIMRAYTTNAGGQPVRWGFTTAGFYAETSNTLPNNEWVNLVFDLDSLYKNSKYAAGSTQTFWNILTPMACVSGQTYDLYISELYLADENPFVPAAEKIYNVNTSDSQLLTSSEVAAIQTEIADTGSVVKFSGQGSKYDGGFVNMPLDYYALRTAYASSGNTANRYLVIRAYTTTAGEMPLAWGFKHPSNTSYYAPTSNTLKNNEWVDLVFDLDALYRNTGLYVSSTSATKFWSIINLLNNDSSTEYDLYISDFYLTDTNPLTN